MKDNTPHLEFTPEAAPIYKNIDEQFGVDTAFHAALKIGTELCMHPWVGKSRLLDEIDNHEEGFIYIEREHSFAMGRGILGKSRRIELRECTITVKLSDITRESLDAFVKYWRKQLNQNPTNEAPRLMFTPEAVKEYKPFTDIGFRALEQAEYEIESVIKKNELAALLSEGGFKACEITVCADIADVTIEWIDFSLRDFTPESLHAFIKYTEEHCGRPQLVFSEKGRERLKALSSVTGFEITEDSLFRHVREFITSDSHRLTDLLDSNGRYINLWQACLGNDARIRPRFYRGTTLHLGGGEYKEFEDIYIYPGDFTRESLDAMYEYYSALRDEE